MTVPASADRLRASLWAGVLVVLAAWPAGAHRFDPALLELREAASGRHEVRWRTTARTEGLTLALPPGCTADGSWPEYTLDCGADGLEGRSLRVDGFAGRPIDVLLRVHRLDGAQQVAILRPDAPTVVVSGRAPGVGRYVRLERRFDALAGLMEKILEALSRQAEPTGSASSTVGEGS